MKPFKSSLLERTVNQYLATVPDPNHFFEILAELFGIQPNSLKSNTVYYWKAGYVFGTAAEKTHSQQRGLDRLSLFLYGLRVPEDHKVIAELREIPTFIYPPADEEASKKVRQTYEREPTKDALINRIYSLEEKHAPAVHTFLDDLLSQHNQAS
ncbi:hypothetical protein C4573_05875 [Candidatus Woesearchaeota archaeon]|nr:MAG: hypothetical protein C4573_05875 [Candidatus Woesearchaeota archaeon]